MDLKKKRIVISLAALISVVGVSTTVYSVLKKDIKLDVNGKVKNISTFKTNVEEVLSEQGVKYDKDDKISLKLDEKLKDGTYIKVVDVKTETIKEHKDIAYEVEIIEDNNLLKGKTEVAQEGSEGKNELIYDLTYHNGQQIDKKFIKEVISIEPINKVIKKGVKEEEAVAISRGENRDNNSENPIKPSSPKGKHMSVVATAYTGHTITSTGATPTWGTIAVDPSIIPYGTKVYIQQFDKVFIAQDTGGAIKGNKIDIYMNDNSSVYNWGRKTIDIYVVV